MKTITIGFSPCPNDTYIFDALINKRIPTGGYEFVPKLADVEALNQGAFRGELDVTKISLGAYARASAAYEILDAGSALGSGVGPLLTGARFIAETEYANLHVAIPGKFTTANLLLSTFFPMITRKTEVVFSGIEDAVLSGRFDAGLLIHEGRFTYDKKGLVKLADLGEVWESRMHMPLPLGCIAASRNLRSSDRRAISDLIRESIQYAVKNPGAGGDYIRFHAQEMDEDVIARHIKLYVNDFSLNLGPEGKAAILFLLSKGHEAGILPEAVQPVFNTDLT